MEKSEVQIRYTDPDAWEANREKVNEILQKHTGTSDYPETKSLPPIMFGVQAGKECIDELKALQGVVVRALDDDE